MSLFLAFKSKKQAYLEPEFEASLVYRLISRTVRALTQRNSVLKNITKNRINCLSNLFFAQLYPLPN